MSDDSEEASGMIAGDQARLPWRGWLLYIGVLSAHAALTAGVVFAIVGGPSRWMLFGLAGGHFAGCSAIGGWPTRYRVIDTNEIVTRWASIQQTTRLLFALIAVVAVGAAAGAPFLDDSKSSAAEAAPVVTPKAAPASPAPAPKAAAPKGAQHH